MRRVKRRSLPRRSEGTRLFCERTGVPILQPFRIWVFSQQVLLTVIPLPPTIQKRLVQLLHVRGEKGPPSDTQKRTCRCLAFWRTQQQLNKKKRETTTMETAATSSTTTGGNNNDNNNNSMLPTMRTPVLLLVDNLLSQDAQGIQSVLETMRRELPPPVVAAYLPALPASLPNSPAIRILDDTFSTAVLVQQHLQVYLQTFPHQAAVASANDGSLPLHFAASLGNVAFSQIVWQAVSTIAISFVAQREKSLAETSCMCVTR